MALDLDALYTDLHRHPELSFQETRTAGVVAQRLAELGIEFEEGVGRTGVVGVIRNPSAGLPRAVSRTWVVSPVIGLAL